MFLTHLDTAEIKKGVLKANYHKPYLHFCKKVVLGIFLVENT